MTSYVNLIILKLFKLSVTVFEYLFINNILFLCKILDALTIDIRHKIVDKLLPSSIKRIKNEQNFIYVHLHGFLLVSPEYFVNRVWMMIVDFVASFLPNLGNNTTSGTYLSGVLGFVGVNNMEVLEIKRDKIIVEEIEDAILKYKISRDNLVIDGVIEGFKSQTGKALTLEKVNEKKLQKYSMKLLENNIDRVNFINSEIYAIATRTLEFDHPVMQLIRSLCRESLYDRAVFSTRRSKLSAVATSTIYQFDQLKQLDLSTLHKFTRSFYMNEELLLNFHLFKYCQQVQKVLGNFVVNFCEKHASKINNNKDIEKFVLTVSNIFEYAEQEIDDDHSVMIDDDVRTAHDNGLESGSLSIDDVLLAVLFNVIEYSMNRVFIEHYWTDQNLFPASSTSNSIVLSRSLYSKFLGDDVTTLVGRENRDNLLSALNVLYLRFKTDNAPFVECINPARMKSCALAV